MSLIPVAPHLNPIDKIRLVPHNVAILNELQSGLWVSNIRLIEISGTIRLTARLNDLRRQGYNIQSRLIKGGLWAYRLEK